MPERTCVVCRVGRSISRARCEKDGDDGRQLLRIAFDSQSGKFALDLREALRGAGQLGGRGAYVHSSPCLGNPKLASAVRGAVCRSSRKESLKEAAGRSALEPSKMVDEALETLRARARGGSIVWKESVAMLEKLRSELSESRSSGKSTGKKIRL